MTDFMASIYQLHSYYVIITKLIISSLTILTTLLLLLIKPILTTNSLIVLELEIFLHNKTNTVYVSIDEFELSN